MKLEKNRKRQRRKSVGSATLYLQNSKYCTIQQEVGGSCCVYFTVHIYTQTKEKDRMGLAIS